jgi:oxepin-CoA hydrolase/3-oxo-5,6-dehydrosuberyl-CoA semialdehyde dehydrogenase
MYRHPPHYRPAGQIDAVSQALIARLEKVVVGDPAQEGVKMGALVNAEQRADVQEKVDQLIAAGCQIRLGGKADLQAAGAFFPPTLLFCPQPDETPAVHATEAFGPVATLMPYRNAERDAACPRGRRQPGGNAGHRSGDCPPVYCRRGARPRAYSDPQRGIIQRVHRPRFPLPQLVHGGPAARAAAKSWAACAR